ncbi:hypothetical protein E0U70_20050 [Salmonella enterica subsp. enterica serovar Gloucester]|nr:hypothetical protein [Salmonella enterica subsp. enterica serovar Gloucester]
MLFTKNKLQYISLFPGQGKTNLMINIIKNHTEQQYIVVSPTKQLSEQIFSSIGEGKVLNSDGNNVDLLETIQKELSSTNHRVIYITDKMFYRVDIASLKNWNVFLDDCVDYYSIFNDVISDVDRDKVTPIYDTIFERINSFGNYVNVCFREGDFSGATLKIKSDFKSLEYFHNIVINKDAFVDAERITAIGYYDLERYASNGINMVYMANNFTDSLIYKRYKDLFVEYQHGIELDTDNVKRVEVYYFSKKPLTKTRIQAEISNHRNTGSETFMEKVSKWIDANLSDYYYTANEAFREYWKLDSDKYVKPNQRGMNNLMDKTVCVWLATMKNDLYVSKVLEEVLGHDAQEVLKQQEYEVMNQLLYRSNLRDYGSEAVIKLYCFDENQAYSIRGASQYQYIDVGVNFEDKRTSSVPHNVRDAFGKWLKRGKRNLDDVRKWLNKKELDSTQKVELYNFYESKMKAA